MGGGGFLILRPIVVDLGPGSLSFKITGDYFSKEVTFLHYTGYIAKDSEKAQLLPVLTQKIAEILLKTHKSRISKASIYSRQTCNGKSHQTLANDMQNESFHAV